MGPGPRPRPPWRAAPSSPSARPPGAAPALSVLASPNRPGPPIADVFSVSCPSSTSCFAVGSGANGAFIQQWNGTRWSTSTTAIPAGAAGSILSGVSCTDATNCFAVGRRSRCRIRQPRRPWSSSGTERPGRSSPARTFPPQYNSALESVSCSSATSCVAVGTNLIEQWDGSSWSLASRAQPARHGPQHPDRGVVREPEQLLAVGTVDFSSTYHGPPKTLTERWNGTSWSIVASPSPTPKFGFGGRVDGRVVHRPDELLRGRQRRFGHADGALERNQLVDQRAPEAPGRRTAQCSVVRHGHELFRSRQQLGVHELGPDAGRTVERNRVEDRRQPEPGRAELAGGPLVRDREQLRGDRHLRRLHGPGVVGRTVERNRVVDHAAPFGRVSERALVGVVCEQHELLRGRLLRRRLGTEDLGGTLERDGMVDRREPQPGRHAGQLTRERVVLGRHQLPRGRLLDHRFRVGRARRALERVALVDRRRARRSSRSPACRA